MKAFGAVFVLCFLSGCLGRIDSNGSLPSAAPTVPVTPPPGKYISISGNDSSPGSFEAPWRTLQHAFDTGNVAPGETIWVRAGTYAGGVIRQDGLPGKPIALKAFNAERVIIDGNLNDTRYKANTLYFYDPSCDPYDATYTVPCRAAHWVLEGLEIMGGAHAEDGAYYAVKVDQPHVTIRNCDIHRSVYDLVKAVKTADHLTLEGNQIHDSGVTGQTNCQGIDVVGADDLLVKKNHIFSIRSIGAYAKGNARRAVFESNLFEDISERAIMLGQSTDTPSLQDGDYECYDCIALNNIIVRTQGPCIGVSSAKDSKVYHNTCYQAASRSQAAIYLSRESEIQTRNCGVDIRNNIIHQAVPNSGVASPLYMVKVGSYGMHNGVTVGVDDNPCPAGFASLVMNKNIYVTESGNSADVKFHWADIGLYQSAGYGISAWRSMTDLDSESLLVDPGFIAPASGNFLPSPSSAAIDAGIALTQMIADYNGIPRPRGAGHDIGALEAP